VVTGATKGFLDALQNAEASQTAVYAKLAEPGPVVDAGLRALDRGIPVVVPELHNQAIAFPPRITPAASSPQCPAGLAPRAAQ